VACKIPRAGGLDATVVQALVILPARPHPPAIPEDRPILPVARAPARSRRLTDPGLSTWQVPGREPPPPLSGQAAVIAANGFDSVDAIRGLKDATHVEHADALLRAQYVAALTDYLPGKLVQ
jgi:hypothetical protein